MNKPLPRGIRNNNPGNIRHGDPWQGLDPESRKKDKDFAVFTSPGHGIRALARVLISYSDKHNLDTVRGIIGRWAPPNENNTAAYVMQVARAIGVGPDVRINVQEYDTMRPLLEAIIRHENGAGPLNTANTWYDDTTVDEGLKMAGVVQPGKTVLSTPEGKAGAVAVGAGGAAGVVSAMAEFGPAVAGHVQAANAATNGFPTWARMLVLALVLVTMAAGAYVLIQKRKQQQATK